MVSSSFNIVFHPHPHPHPLLIHFLSPLEVEREGHKQIMKAIPFSIYSFFGHFAISSSFQCLNSFYDHGKSNRM